MKTYLLLSLLITASSLNFGFTSKSNWDTARENEKVKLQYRYVQTQDNKEFREFRAVLNISSSLPKLLRNIKDVNRLSQWIVKAKACEIFTINENEWITYTLFDIPKPLTQHDLVLKHTIHHQNKDVIIKLSPLPNYLPTPNKVSRLNEYIGYWKITPNGTNQLKAEFYYTPTKKPTLPRFIMDPILQKMLIESFIKLVELSEMD